METLVQEELNDRVQQHADEQETNLDREMDDDKESSIGQPPEHLQR